MMCIKGNCGRVCNANGKHAGKCAPIMKASIGKDKKTFICTTCHMQFGSLAWKTRHVCRQDVQDDASTVSAEMSDIGKKWTSKDKIKQRFEFALECKIASGDTQLQDILYLESEDGYATQALVDIGFKPPQLHPCNDGKGDDPDCESKIMKMYPGIQFEKGNIMEIAKTRKWLGIWYDTTSTWHRDGEWNTAEMPEFDNAVVIAINLCSRGIKGVNCEDLGILLSNLLNDKGGHTSAQPRAYEGVSGWQNMVFGLATFPPPPPSPVNLDKYIGAILYVPINLFSADSKKYQWPLDWKNGYRIRTGNSILYFVATVSDVTTNDRFLVKFIQKNGLPFSEPDDWWRPTLFEIFKYLDIPVVAEKYLNM